MLYRSVARRVQCVRCTWAPECQGPTASEKNLTSNQTLRIYCRSFKSIIISFVSEILKFKQTEMAKLTDINVAQEYIFKKKCL